MKKKLLYVVTRAATAGGVMSIVSKKINYLTDKGYEITLLSMTKCEKPFYSIHHTVRLICCSNNEDFSVGTKDLIRAIKVIRNGSFDIIISADAQYVTWILPFITRKKTVLEIHQSYDGLIDFYNKGHFAKLNLLAHKFMQRLTFVHYDKVVVLTNEDKNKWNLPNSIVIPNFHNIVIAPDRYDLKVPSKKIVCVGRFGYQKGFDLLIKIWKLVSIKCPDFQLHYYGIKSTPEVEKEMSRFSAPSSFILEGHERNLAIIYADAYLNIVASRCESFSLTTIESMCFGVPTVSFDTTGPRSIIEDRKDGRLISCFNVEEAANVIVELINNKYERFELSKACVKKSLLFKEDVVMKRWMDVFDD